MEKAELEALVEKALKEHPEVFPSSPQIAELLKNDHGMRLGLHKILDNIDISSLELNWINSCPERAFLEHLSKKAFVSLDEKCKEAAKERFRRLVETKVKNNPDVFPDGPNIVRLLLEKYVVKIMPGTIHRNLDLLALQLNWVNSCRDKAFLENIRNGIVRSLDAAAKEEARKRLGKIIKAQLGNYPEVFPVSSQIGKLLEKSYGVMISVSNSHLSKSTLSDFQLNWINSCPEKAFLENMSRSTFNNLRKKCMDAAAERFKKIVKRELQDHPEMFPDSIQIAELLCRYGKGITRQTVCLNLDLHSIQLEWINSCEDAIFLENFSKRKFIKLNKDGRNAVKIKFENIVKKELQNYPRILPTPNIIVELLKNSYRVGISTQIPRTNLDLPSIQLNWINSCEKDIFLENFSMNRFGGLDKRCKEAVNARMYDLLLSHLNDLNSLSLCRQTLDNYLKKFPDLAFFLSAAEEHRFTLDQRIILAMRIWKESRSEDLHKLIGERLEQLWGFRELFALMKDKRCLDADVISMFHESMPEMIAGYVPDAAIRHSFVDDLSNGKFRPGAGKDVLLLSFMHWLTEKQTAEILLRLNKAVGADNTIFMTSPNGLQYSSELIRLLNEFGFTPEKIGTLYLLPPDVADEQEQWKLLTKSKVLQFRKMKDVETVPEKAELFSGEQKKGGGERPEPTAEIISYDKDTLKRAISLISMREIASVFIEEAPEIRKVGTEDDIALLELKGGAVVGFNMDKKHPYSIEIEGTRIPKGTDNAILNVMNGKEGFMVGEGMKGDYRKFLELIREKRERIGEVKKTLLKQNKAGSS